MSLAHYSRAAQRVVDHLQSQEPMGAWVVADVDALDGGCTIVAVADRGYGLQPGTHVGWGESLCLRMVAGTGSPAVPDVGREHAGSLAAGGGDLLISAYVGAAITVKGRLVGSVCGFDPEPRGDLDRLLPLTEVLADLLAELHSATEAIRQATDRASAAELTALSDPLTGVLSRLGWLTALEREKDRCSRDGSGLVLASIDCNGLKALNDRFGHSLGDALLIKLARALRHAVRRGDVLARLGGDEFGVLSPATHPEEAEQLRARLAAALAVEDLDVAVGTAWWSVPLPVEVAWGLADRRMYADKRLSQTARR